MFQDVAESDGVAFAGRLKEDRQRIATLEAYLPTLSAGEIYVLKD